MLENQLLKKFLVKLQTIFIFVLILVFVFAGMFFLNNYLSIINIVIIGEANNIYGLDEIKNKNIIFTSNDYIKEILVKKNPSIELLEITKELPKTLKIKVENYKPVAELIVNNGVYGLSYDGKIIYKSKKNNLNILKVNFYQKLPYEQYNIGERITYQEILTGISFIKSFSKLNLKPDNLDINGINVLVFNLENKKIILSSEKSVKEQAFQLEQIIKEFKITGRQFKEIDLRFDKPVIRF